MLLSQKDCLQAKNYIYETFDKNSYSDFRDYRNISLYFNNSLFLLLFLYREKNEC